MKTTTINVAITLIGRANFRFLIYAKGKFEEKIADVTSIACQSSNSTR